MVAGLPGPAEAIIIDWFPVSLVAGQSLQVNVVNLGGPDTMCEVGIIIICKEGDRLAEQGILIVGGKTRSLTLNRDLLDKVNDRLLLRAQVQVLSSRCDNLIGSSIEVVDNATGRTAFVGTDFIVIHGVPAPR
jgi:hypothetical protein